MVAGTELARYLTAQPKRDSPDWLPAQSTRNRFAGIVTRVERDGLTAVIEIVAGPHRVVSLMTREAADDLGLAPGDIAVAAVKATTVIVEAPRHTEHVEDHA